MYVYIYIRQRRINRELSTSTSLYEKINMNIYYCLIVVLFACSLFVCFIIICWYFLLEAAGLSHSGTCCVFPFL